MNELDATTIAAVDAEKDIEKLSTAVSPDDVRIRIENRIYFRLFRLETKEAFEGSKVVLQKPVSDRPNTSLVTSDRVVKVMRAVAPLMPYEDMRAFLEWLVGSPEKGRGYFQSMLETFPDSGTISAMAEVEGLATDLRAQMLQRDTRLFQVFVRNLPQQKQRLIQGLLLEARWANAEDDGDRMRLRLIAARKLSEKLVKNHLRAEKMFGAQDIEG